MNKIFFISVISLLMITGDAISQKVTGVDPDSGRQGDTMTISVTGSKTVWTLAAYYWIVFTGPPGDMQVDNVQIINDTLITGHLRIALNALVGVRDMSVIDPFQNKYFLQDAFFVDFKLSIVDKTSNIMPSKFYVGNNYPNPFNPVTKIRFGLPINQDVIFSVYDLSGRTLAKLNLGNLSAAEYELTWDASKFASGTYIYGIESENFRKFKKMVVLK